jgi:hypothetical protein
VISFDDDLKLRGGDGDGRLIGDYGIIDSSFILEVEDAVIRLYFFNFIHLFYNISEITFIDIDDHIFINF